MDLSKKKTPGGPLPFSLPRLTLLALLIVVLTTHLFQPPASVLAATTLSVTPLTWNIMGLDSNNVNVGPNDFPVGARVCNTGGAAASNVTATFTWTSANALINIRPGTNTSLSVASLGVGACTDFYFEVEITRNAAAYDTTRRYQISVTADSGATTGITPTPREIYVEHLISQNRNSVTDVQYGLTIPTLTSVPGGGTMSLIVGQTYYIRVVGATATQGYEQIESFITIPNTIFQILSVNTTYSAESSPTLAPPYDKLYGDACLWESDPNSPNYRACNGTGKAGGNITVTYQVKILQVPGAPLVNPQPLSTLIYDFSGSSYHYNSDVGVSTRYAYIIDPAAVTISKNFSPDPTTAGGASTLTFTLTNPTPVAFSGLNFTDVLPVSPGAMVVASSPNASTTGCGSPTFAPTAGATSLSFSNGSLAANSSCTIKVSVTAPVSGTYTNTSNHLFINTLDTGNSATDTLTVNSAPTGPSPVCGLTMAQWTFAGFTVDPPPFPAANPRAPDVTTAAISVGNGLTAAADTSASGGNPQPGIRTYGFLNATAINPVTSPYIQFAIDTSKYSQVTMQFDAQRKSNGPSNDVLYYSTDGTTWTQKSTFASTTSWATYGAYSFTGQTNTSGVTYFRILGNGANATSSGNDMNLDNVIFTGCGTPTPATISKAFSTNPVAIGATSTLTFTVTNPNSGVAFTGVSFTDTLPSGLTVTSGSSTQCGGTLTTTAPQTISFGGGTLAVSTSCTINVTVTATASGIYDNVSGLISSTQGGTNSGTSGIATASLTVLKPPVISKLFAPNPILAGATSTLTLTISNPNLNDSLSSVQFSDTLPASPGQMRVAATPNAATSGCGSPTFAPGASATSLSFTNGTIAAGGTCTVSVSITAPTTGIYTNTTSSVQATISGTTTIGNAATDTLTVNPPHPSIGLLKQISTSATGPWTSFVAVTTGTNVYYQFTIENTGDVALSPVGVSDPQVSTASCSWPASLPVAVAGNNNHIATCVVGPVATVSGAHTNTATASGTYSGTAYTDSSSAKYATTGLTLAKSVTEASFASSGDVLHYSYLVTNSGDASLLGPVTVSDNKATVTCPAVSTIGDLDAYLDPGESLTCTATYTVTVADFAATSVTNTASATIGGVTSNPDSKTVYRSLADLTVTKVDDVSNSLQLGSTFNWTLTVSNSGLAPASFADTNMILSDFLPGIAAYYPQGALTIVNGAIPPTGTIVCSISGTALTCDAAGAVDLPIGSSFTVSFPVTPTSSGSLTNMAIVDPNDNVLEIDEGNNTGTDIVSVVSPPSISKSFTASTIPVNGSTTITFIITNPVVNTVTLMGVSFTDTYPAGLQNAAVPNASTTCSSGTVTAAPNGSSISLSGATIAVNNICTVTVTVVGTTTGTKTNSVTVSSLNGGTGNTAVAKLGVVSAVKTVVATSEDASAEAGAPRNVLIGEIVRYHLVLDLPEGTTINLQVIEGIVANMAYMNDGSTRIAFVCNSGAACASSSTVAIGSNPVINGNASNITPTFTLPAASISGGSGNPYGDAVDPIFSLGDVTNNDNDSDAEYVVIEFNALVRNTSQNQNGSTRGNTFTVYVNGLALVTSTDTANSRINVIEPVISTITKSITTTPLDAGDAISYQLQVTNSGNAPAFDITVTDTLSAALTTPVVVTGSTTGGSCGSTPSNVSGSFTSPSVTATVTCLAAGGTATINISAVVADTAAPGSTINNSASLIYTSLPGTGTAGNLTGSTTPGASGAATGERNGSGGTNDYVATSNVVNTSLTTSPTIAKQLTTTSASDTSGTDVAIGEEITYDLLITFPEGTTASDTVLDDLPPGLSLVSGTPQVITTAAASGGLLAADFNGTIGTQTTTPVLGDGGSLTFSFTNVAVAGDNDPTNNSILLRFRAQVSNIAGNQAGTSLSNTATNQVGVGTPTASNTVAVTVVEPAITFTKTIVAVPNPAGIGGVVQYSISYVNATGATVSAAMDVHITDALPAQLSLTLPITVTLGGGAAGVTDASSGNNVDVTVDTVPAGGSLTIDYSGTIQSGVTIGQNISNTADGIWTSLSGTVAGERTGADGPAGLLNDYAATSTQGFTISSPDLNIVKTDGATTYTPGSLLTYTITVNNAGDTTGAGTVTDTFPAALTNVSWTCSGTGGATCSASGTGDINDSVSIPAGQSVTYTIAATALSSATGNLVNSATATLINATDPTPNDNTSTDTDTPVYSADLEITKTDGITNITSGVTTAYTIVVTNHGPSDADNTVFTDPAITGLNVTGVSCGGATGGAVCPTAGNTTVALMQGAGIVIPTLPSGGSLTFTVNATVTATTGSLANIATVTTPAGVTDPGTSPNSATDTDTLVEIIAVDDTGSAVNGSSGGQSLANVLTNDTLNGSPATLATINLSQISTTNPGVTLDAATGAVNVAAGTAAGTYTLVYQICDQANPTICDTATVTVPVVQIDAVNDTGVSVNGATGGQALADVLTNDMLNGSPATLATVNLSQVSTTDPGVTLDPATGAVNVAAGTPAGTYSLVYQICDQANPTICDTATVTVPVVQIDAVNDTGSSVSGAIGGQSLANVLANDTLNGIPATLVTVNLSQISTTNAGVTLDVATGAVNVAAGTAAGTYTLVYQICDQANPTICDTATVTVPVVTIDAVNDTGTTVNGATGGQSLANVLTNDTLNGSLATLANINLSQISTTNPGVTLNLATGAVNVAAGTPAGNYSLVYQICDQANPTICDTATVTVPVVTIDAVNDTGSSVNGAAGGQSLADVLTNDALNANPATLATVNLSQISTTNPGVTLNAATGAVNVAPGTAAGNYTVTYQICDQANPSICDQATVTVPVSASTILAADDSASGVNGITGATAVLNVFTNDTLNGSAVLPADVALTETVPDPTGALILNPDGTVDVAPGTASGIYQLTYRICEVLNPTNCDTAIVSVTVVAPAQPIARDDSATTPFNTPVTLPDITANDSAFGAGNSIVIATIDLDPSTAGQQTSFTDTNGNQWSVNTTTGDVLFTPAATFSGTATIPYEVQDTPGQTATANLTVTVGAPASISGVVYNDNNLNGTQNAGETGIGSVKVDLYDSSGTTLIASVTTTSGGSYSFPNLTAGTYRVVETDPTGYVSTTPNSVAATVSAGGSAMVNFGDYRLPNTALSGITGMVFNDANANGVQDSGEAALSGVTIELRNNLGTVVATTTTNSLGSYSFTNLAAGQYTVTETDPTGYISTTLNNVTVNLSAGTTATVNFGDQTAGTAQIADPAVTKYGSPTNATVGGAVVYTLTVGNNGNGNATNVVLTDTKPAFLDLVSITISPNPGLTPAISGNTFTINFGTVAPGDTYVVTVVTRVNAQGQPPGGSNKVSITTTSITDRVFNNAASAALQITSGGTAKSVRSLPETGFAPGIKTDLSHTPHETYLRTGDVTVEVPSLGIKIPVVGVPLRDGTWNVAWLGNQAGWLGGTAFPSWNGNSVLTGHVYLSNGQPGPFVNLGKLKYGDKIIVHAYGQKYTFAVQTNVIAEPSDTSAFKHEEKPWLTLITCKEYDEKSNIYHQRVVVRAALVSVSVE